MFQQLRPNSQIYILHKGNDTVTWETGFVASVSQPRLKYNNQPMLSNPQSMVVDISVNVGGGQPLNYAQLDAGADIAESFSNGENTIIATSKEAMNAKIASLKQMSQDVINSESLHRKLIVEYDKVLREMNPEFAEKEQQKNEIKMMKEQMQEMSKNMNDLLMANKVLMEKINKGGLT